MKKKLLNFLFFIITMFFIFSCSNDDSNPPNDAESALYGNWNEILVKSYKNDVLIYSSDEEESSINESEHYTLESNGNLIITDFSYDGMTQSCETINSKWFLAENGINIDEFAYDYEILENGNLVLYSSETDGEDFYEYETYFEKSDARILCDE